MSYAIRAISGKGFPAMSQRSETDATDAPTAEGLPEAGQGALSTLRNLWSAQGQGSHDVDESSCESNEGSTGNRGGQCKMTQSMGFEGLIDEVEATADTDEAVDNVQTAWRKKLEREGKLSHEGRSIRDMVLGSQSSGGQ